MASPATPKVGGTERRTLLFPGIRQKLRELEWSLPVPVQRPLWRLLGARFDPYTARDRETRSIFIHVPKNAGTSIGLAIGVQRRHLPISRYAAFDAEAYKSYFKFGFVRNPWDRLLSAYSFLLLAAEKDFPFRDTVWARNHIKKFPDFESFVLSLRDPKTRGRIMNYIHFRPQISWLTLPGSNEVALDFVGRFERLPEDFAMIAERLSLSTPLPITNRSPRGSYRDSYSNQMRDIVANLYRADIEAFDYDF